MQRRIAVEYDKFTGITEETFYDEDTKKLTLRRSQDVEHTLALNKVMFNTHTSKKPSYQDSTGGAHHVARIPFMVIEKWMREGFDWYKSTDKERRAKLNNSDFSKLLVRPGRL